MIPLSDASRRPMHLPLATMLIVLANSLVFLVELVAGDAFINQWSLVPAQVMAGHNLITILTSMFMHAGWLHILGNMLFLWVFGPEIEDVMGPLRYLTFYLLGGLAATFAQAAMDPTSTVPNLGASGAIAAVMGAFLITYPRDQIRTVLLLGFFVRITLVPALLLVGIWFLTQVFSEVGSVTTMDTGGVAYMAHVGGFLFGAVFGRFFETRGRRLDEGLEA
jgi:membrane associated rhomboid family serine protease